MLLDLLPLFKRKAGSPYAPQPIPDLQGRGAVSVRFLLRSDVSGRAEFAPVPIRFTVKASMNGHADKAFWRRRDEAVLSALGVL